MELQRIDLHFRVNYEKHDVIKPLTDRENRKLCFFVKLFFQYIYLYFRILRLTAAGFRLSSSWQQQQNFLFTTKLVTTSGFY